MNGREVDQLLPIQRLQWRTWKEIAAILNWPADDDWDRDRDLVDQAPSDPFLQ